jgi:hypothetical protein
MPQTRSPRHPGTDDAPPATSTPDPYPAVPAPAPPPTPCLPAPDDLTQDELAMFEQMNDALRAKTLEMRELARTEIAGLLQSRYELGSIVLKIKNDPATYGPLSDIQLAGFFGESGRTLYAEARRIRERYPPERFAEIVAAVNSQTGARIHYKHLSILLRIESDAEADKTLELCLGASWSTKELADHVAKKIREAQGAQRPRTRSKPTNFLGVVEHIGANNEAWYKTYQEDWGAGQKLFHTFDALPAEQLTASLATKIGEAEEQVQVAAQALAHLARDLAGLKKRTEQAVSTRQQGGPQATAHHDEEDEAEEEGDDE